MAKHSSKGGRGANYTHDAVLGHSSTGLLSTHASSGLSTVLTGRHPVLTPRALDGSAVNELALELDDSHGGVLVRVELDKGESSVGLHSDLDDVAVALAEASVRFILVSTFASREKEIKRRSEREEKNKTNLEERDEVGLGRVGDEVSNVNGRVEGRGLGDDNIVAEGSALEVDGSGSTSSTSRSRRGARETTGTTGLGLLLECKETNVDGRQ